MARKVLCGDSSLIKDTQVLLKLVLQMADREFKKKMQLQVKLLVHVVLLGVENKKCTPGALRHGDQKVRKT